MELEFLNWIQTLRTEALDVLVPLITRLGNAGILWILLTAVLLAVPRTRRTGLVLAVALLIDLLLCNVILKPMVARMRPFDANPAVKLLIPPPRDYSFPSGHTAASFAAVAALYLSGARRLWKAALLVALCIAASRLYLYVHYPTDVLGGVAVGLLSGWFGSRLCQRMLRGGSGRKHDG